MKTWEHFRLDAYWAYNAIAEAEGFKSGAEKRQKQREAMKKASKVVDTANDELWESLMHTHIEEAFEE